MCKGITGLLFGHKFTSLTTKLTKEPVEKGEMQTWRYIIICPRCGKGISVNKEKREEV